MEVLILNDNLFEFEETFMGEIVRVADESDAPLTQVDGLTVNPTSTTVTIQDNDGTNVLTCIQC